MKKKPAKKRETALARTKRELAELGRRAQTTIDQLVRDNAELLYQLRELNPGVEVSLSAPFTSLDGRKLTLDKAREYVARDRNADYGDPEDNFFTIGNLWSEHLRERTINIGSITPADVAAMMVLMKVARLKTSPRKADNWIDMAGYAACGAGIAALEDLAKIQG